MSNFDWLTDDVKKRLPAEGKKVVADAVYAAIRGKARDACRDLERIAREHREARIELYAIFLEIMGGYDRGEHYEPLLDRAFHMVARASELGSSLSDERICHYEWVLYMFEQIDHPGYANDIIALTEDLDRRLPAGEDCRNCVLYRRGGGREALGDLDGAVEIYSEWIALTTGRRRRADRLLDLVALEARRGRIDAAEGYLQRAVEEAEKAEGDRADLDLRLASMRVILATARGALDDAAHDCDALLGRSKPWNFDVLDADLHLARALVAEGRIEEALPRAERCAVRAGARGGRRRHVEALLISAEALVAGGRRAEARAHVEALEQAVPKLKSGDLDDRARSLGARIDVRR